MTAGIIYECLREASSELFPTGDQTEVTSWEEYDGMDKEVYERAAELMVEKGVRFP